MSAQYLQVGRCLTGTDDIADDFSLAYFPAGDNLAAESSVVVLTRAKSLVFEAEGDSSSTGNAPGID